MVQKGPFSAWVKSITRMSSSAPGMGPPSFEKNNEGGGMKSSPPSSRLRNNLAGP
jgi:hypothetical protein